MWTTHGHQIIGTIALDPVSNNRPTLARCGGPEVCKMCSIEAAQARKDAGLDEFGNKIAGTDTAESPAPVNDILEKLKNSSIEVLDETADIGRMLGRIELALMATRPASEAEAINQKISMMVAEHRVLMDTPRTASVEYHNDNTMEKVFSALMNFVDKDRAEALVSAMQDAGIVFREKA